jgi:hypothetical protein
MISRAWSKQSFHLTTIVCSPKKGEARIRIPLYSDYIHDMVGICWYFEGLVFVHPTRGQTQRRCPFKSSQCVAVAMASEDSNGS